jgi:Mrp family chromosome partitioning ATPase
MEQIREAIERAKAADPLAASQAPRNEQVSPPVNPVLSRPTALRADDRALVLNTGFLKSNRIITHDYAEPNAAAFDMLRTQVLQAMDPKDWRFLGVTSPTQGCGKTVTAVNLALSIARQPERSVLLVDLDLRKPRLATSLGLQIDKGVLTALDNRTSLAEATIQVCIGSQSLTVLPTESPTRGSSDRMASRAMRSLLQQIKQYHASGIVIFDLPPVLPSDDVLTIAPQLDCLLLVAAVGDSSISEIDQTNKRLQSSEILRIVLNKVPATNSRYYYY